MANSTDVGGGYRIIKISTEVEWIEKNSKVERVRNFSLAERHVFMWAMRCLERDRAEIMAKYPNPKHLTFPELLKQVEKNVQPQEENPAYILDIGNHNDCDISGVIVDIGNHNDCGTSGVIVDIESLK